MSQTVGTLYPPPWKVQRKTASRGIYINVYIQNEQTSLILGPSTLIGPFNHLDLNRYANTGIRSKELTI